jgi:DNA primase
MSGLISRHFIDNLLTRCDIVELIDARVPLKKQGKNYVACCPFHQENSPSFTVSSSKQFYHCFGCGVGGNAISFLMAYERVDFVEAVEALAKQFNLTVHRENQGEEFHKKEENLYAIMAEAVQFYQAQLLKSKPAQAYLSQRGITLQSIEQFQLGFAPVDKTGAALLQYLTQSRYTSSTLQALGLIQVGVSGQFHDQFRARIIFPIRDRQGRYIGLGARALPGGQPKYLNSPETPIFHKRQALYGLYEACQQHRQFEKIWVVEGYMDVLALVQAGLSNAVAALGTAISETQLRRLFNLSPAVIFCFDGDQAGTAAAWRALEAALTIIEDGWQLRFLFLPEGEDPDSWLRREAGNNLNNLLPHALSLSDFFFYKLQQSVSIDTEEGRAKLKQLVFAQLNKMPDGLIQEQLLERLARIVRTEVAILRRLKNQPKRLLDKRLSKKAVHLSYTPKDRAAALLLQYPQFAEVFKQDLQTFLPSHYPLLVKLFSLIQQYPSCSTGRLLECFRDAAEYELLVQLSHYQCLLPLEKLQQEFKGILHYLKRQIYRQLTDNFLQKARQKIGNGVHLTQKDKQYLSDLVAKNLEKRE